MTQPSILDPYHQVALKFSKEEDCDCIEHGLVIVQLQALHEEQQIKCKGMGKVKRWPMRVECDHIHVTISCGKGFSVTNCDGSVNCHGLGWVACEDMATLMQQLPPFKLEKRGGQYRVMLLPHAYDTSEDTLGPWTDDPEVALFEATLKWVASKESSPAP